MQQYRFQIVIRRMGGSNERISFLLRKTAKIVIADAASRRLDSFAAQRFSYNIGVQHRKRNIHCLALFPHKGFVRVRLFPAQTVMNMGGKKGKCLFLPQRG